jgi:periplasmic protein TonB
MSTKESNMSHTLQISQNGVVGQNGVVDRRVSNLSLVVFLHLALGVALYTSVRQVSPPVVKPPTVFRIYTDVPPPPVIPRQPQTTAARLSHTTPQISTPQNPLINSEVPVVVQNNIAIESINRDINVAPVADTAQSAGGEVAPTSNLAVVCPNSRAIQSEMRYPMQARREGAQGEVIVQFILTANGAVINQRIISSASPLLNRAALNAVSQFQCMGVGRDVAVEAPFVFRLGE